MSPALCIRPPVTLMGPGATHRDTDAEDDECHGSRLNQAVLDADHKEGSGSAQGESVDGATAHFYSPCDLLQCREPSPCDGRPEDCHATASGYSWHELGRPQTSDPC